MNNSLISFPTEQYQQLKQRFVMQRQRKKVSELLWLVDASSTFDVKWRMEVISGWIHSSSQLHLIYLVHHHHLPALVFHSRPFLHQVASLSLSIATASTTCLVSDSVAYTSPLSSFTALAVYKQLRLLYTTFQQYEMLHYNRNVRTDRAPPIKLIPLSTFLTIFHWF